MSGFSIDWLDLREHADRRARDATLRDQALTWLERARSPTKAPLIVDLGAGTGATLRALTTPNNTLIWRLVDNDHTLLTEAQHRHGQEHQIETHTQDLTQLNALPLAGAHLITASALFDLVSKDFIQALANTLLTEYQQNPIGLYAALNYDGTTHWAPEHPLDAAVLHAFNKDQQRDKGFGPALGPEAGEVMDKTFTQAGFKVFTASSPWELNGGEDEQLMAALIDGIAGAVAESAEIDASALTDWVEFRKTHAATGRCTVGHVDLLALPI